MAIHNSTKEPTQKQGLAKLRKSFEETRKHHIEREQSQIEFTKTMLKHARKSLGMWYMQKAYRSAPCCPKCERFVPGGVLYCTVCGTRLVVIDLFPKKTR
jgi:hypothetical protein